MNTPRHCYLCGDEMIPVPPGHQGRKLPKHETRDHVPPDGLFCEPKPSNPIKIPCCDECNNKHSAADEQFRVLTAIQLGANDAGHKIAMKKVFGSTIQKLRQPKFIMALAQTMRPAVIKTPQGGQEVVRLSTDAAPVFSLIKNMVKGLLCHFHPEFDYRFQRFQVREVTAAKMAAGQADQDKHLCALFMAHTTEDGRGNFDEFRFWRKVEPENQLGKWLLLFYDAVAFIVTHEPLPKVHLLTCPQREAMCNQTLARWALTDWPTAPCVHHDRAKEDAAMPWGHPARARRLTDAFAEMLRAALAEPGAECQWILLLEDDLDFHPKIAGHVSAWGALDDVWCEMASLFNPSLRAVSPPNSLANGFEAEPASFVGAQAVLLRRGAAQRALAAWNSLPGMMSQRLAKLLSEEGPIWVHQPSLVQHVAKDSSWGARIQQALDFDPA